MQVVIDISKQDYIYIAKKHCLPSCDDRTLRKYIYEMITNGTPLPKGHKRLIEDNFDVGPVFDAEGYRIGYKYVTQEDLNNAPTIVEADKGGR